ncbi:MAG: SLC13 family permease [Gammaproteobacteria bacterium]
MNTDHLILFMLLACVFALLIWGRWRYDVIAFGALIFAVLTGVVPAADAFSGFGHPATIIVALVLVVSRGLSNSGAIELLSNRLVDASRGLRTHIAVMTSFSAALSALMNNVAALAMLMPIDVQVATRAKRSPALTLMPVSFASILGGMLTLIGTPPNIVVAEFRNEALGAPFRMFDFTPVGLACAAAGLLFLTTVGWKLLPAASRSRDATGDLFELGDYVAELLVPEQSTAIGRQVRDLDETAEDSEAAIVGLVRRGRRMPGMARRIEIRKGDTLVVKADPEGIDKLVGALDLEYVRGNASEPQLLAAEDLHLAEVVVPPGARIVGRSALSVQLLYRHGVTLLGVSRCGKRFAERVRKLEIQEGDVLLLLGAADRVPEVIAWLGCLPLAERGLAVLQRSRAWLTVGVFAAAVVVASLGWVYLPVALGAVAVVMVLTNIVPPRQLYDSVEWPVVVLLGSMIPIGGALEHSGGTTLIAEGLLDLTAGAGPVVVLALLMIVTMTLSDVLNNVATAVITAPIALDVAGRLGVNPDPFLMGVAVAASCAFLTPIGHKNNTMILGPGGYRFGDYWRMGLPLEILIIAVSVPMLLIVWPLR